MHIQAHHSQPSPLASLPSATSAATRLSTNAAASATTPSTPTSTSTATITANDFLQLLVTELQNQDPTADTDPNEYVDQLVQVNSLQQQIQMNETLDGGPTLTGSSSGMLQELVDINQTLDGVSASASAGSAQRSPGSERQVGGNLSPGSHPKTEAAAEKVASALAPPSSQAAGLGPTQAFAEFAARLKANAQQR